MLSRRDGVCGGVRERSERKKEKKGVEAFNLSVLFFISLFSLRASCPFTSFWSARSETRERSHRPVSSADRESSLLPGVWLAAMKKLIVADERPRKFDHHRRGHPSAATRRFSSPFVSWFSSR